LEAIADKRCRDCGETKPVSEFWRWSQAKDGLGVYCKPCGGIRSVAYAARRRERQGLPPVIPKAKAPEVPEGMKWCRDCGQVKPLDEFPIATRKANGRNTYCKPCFAARVVASRIKVHGDRREYHLRHRYGIGVADVERMLEAQDGKCLICEKPEPEHVDHDHGTGKVRGILCFNCNQGLGNFRDDMRSLIRAVDYLMRGSSWSGKGLDGFQVKRFRSAAA
jgi:hypothetical protein